MLASRLSLLAGAAARAPAARAPARSMSVIATPARTRVSTGEQIALSAFMIIGWTFIPAWVLVHIKDYRNKQ